MGSVSASPFRYPSTRHKRRLQPGPFPKPRDYIDELSEEFHHCCVYCLFPDAFGASFEVEHYRPYVKFKHLRTEYSNLFYACRTCNGRKGKKWFEPTPGGAYIVNPCQDSMAQNLWYKGGRVEPRSPAGRLTEDALRLNDAASIEHRNNIDAMIDDTWTRLRDFRRRRKKLTKAINRERDSKRSAMLQAALKDLDAEIERREALLRKALAPHARPHGL